MALPASGAITLLDLVTEFGGSPTHELTEYYRGGAYVPDVPANSGVPTSGLIGLTSFYGAVNRRQVTITLSTNQTNYVLNTAKVAGYMSGLTDVTLVINAGVYVSANSTGSYALDVDTSWATGDTISIVNNGFIVGMGGAGGSSSGASGVGSNGAAGGSAFRAQRAVSVTNNGTIGGGGGGGGGGRSRSYAWSDKVSSGTYTYAGGGGGGGRSGSTSSSGGTVRTSVGVVGRAAAVGGSGTTASAGAGGLGAKETGTAIEGGVGGNGGDWGAAGATGGSGAGSGTTIGPGPYTGGAAGAAVAGNANITWVLLGTRLGAVT